MAAHYLGRQGESRRWVQPGGDWIFWVWLCTISPRRNLSLLSLGQSTVSTAVEARVVAQVKADCRSGEDLDTGWENCEEPNSGFNPRQASALLLNTQP